MNISKYISELLFDYECVVLPGLGGFITNQQSATINRVSHQFNPPYSKIFFNVHLTANDGLLVNHIAASETLDYQLAKNQVDVYVKSVLLRLETGEKILFENIGTLEFDENQNIHFEQITTINYNSSSFGLSSIISPTIKRKTDEEKLRGLIFASNDRKRKPADRRPVDPSPKRKRGFVKSTAVIASIAIFVFSLSWGLMQRDQVANYWQEQASLFSFSNSSPTYQPRSSTQGLEQDEVFNEEIGSNLPDATVNFEVSENLSKTEEKITEPIETEEISTSNPPLVEANPKVKIENKPELVKEELIKPKVKPSGKLYYVVAGSFSSEINASKLVATLRQKGYEALIADTTSKGMYRVAYLGDKDLAYAKEQLYAIRQDDNPDAWIFRK